MDLLVIRSDSRYASRAKFFPIASPSFQITENIVDNQAINNAKTGGVNGYAMRLKDLYYGQFFDYEGDSIIINPGTRKLFGFVRVGNRQFITSESKVQNFREQFFVMLPASNNSDDTFSKSITFSPSTTVLDIQFQCDDRSRIRIRYALPSANGTAFTNIRKDTGFDENNIVSKIGMRIPRSSAMSGVIGVIQSSTSTAEVFKLIRITMNEDGNGCIIATNNNTEDTLISPTEYDINRVSSCIEYYQENDFINILNDRIDGFNASIDDVNLSMQQLQENMNAINTSMASLRKDVDELTSNNAALFVSR